MPASDDGEKPYLLPVPITALVLPDPVATEADLQPAPPAETVAEAPPPAPLDEDPVAAVRAAAVPAPTAVIEPPVLDENELTPVSASVDELTPTVAEPGVAESPPPVPAVTAPATQVAALPSIPNDSGETNSNGDGRTYGVINREARVIIGAEADSWVQVLDNDQNVLLTRMLHAGDRYLVPNREDLVMLTGNAGGLIISVDGALVPKIGSDGAILNNVRLDVELLKAGRAVVQ